MSRFSFIQPYGTIDQKSFEHGQNSDLKNDNLNINDSFLLGYVCANTNIPIYYSILCVLTTLKSNRYAKKSNRISHIFPYINMHNAPIDDILSEFNFKTMTSIDREKYRNIINLGAELKLNNKFDILSRSIKSGNTKSIKEIFKIMKKEKDMITDSKMSELVALATELTFNNNVLDILITKCKNRTLTIKSKVLFISNPNKVPKYLRILAIKEKEKKSKPKYNIKAPPLYHAINPVTKKEDEKWRRKEIIMKKQNDHKIKERKKHDNSEIKKNQEDKAYQQQMIHEQLQQKLLYEQQQKTLLIYQYIRNETHIPCFTFSQLYGDINIKEHDLGRMDALSEKCVDPNQTDSYMLGYASIDENGYTLSYYDTIRDVYSYMYMNLNIVNTVTKVIDVIPKMEIELAKELFKMYTIHNNDDIKIDIHTISTIELAIKNGDVHVADLAIKSLKNNNMYISHGLFSKFVSLAIEFSPTYIMLNMLIKNCNGVSLTICNRLIITNVAHGIVPQYISMLAIISQIYDQNIWNLVCVNTGKIPVEKIIDVFNVFLNPHFIIFKFNPIEWLNNNMDMCIARKIFSIFACMKTYKNIQYKIIRLVFETYIYPNIDTKYKTIRSSIKYTITNGNDMVITKLSHFIKQCNNNQLINFTKESINAQLELYTSYINLSDDDVSNNKIRTLLTLVDNKTIAILSNNASTYGNMAFLIHVIKHYRQTPNTVIPMYIFNTCMDIGSRNKYHEIVFGLMYNLLPSFEACAYIHPDMYNNKENMVEFSRNFDKVATYAKRKYPQIYNKSREIRKILEILK